MTLSRRAILATVALCAGFCASIAHADDDISANSLRLGYYGVFYHTRADNLSGPYVPPGVNFKAEDLTTLYFAYVRRLTSSFELELALGYPPLSKVEGKGPPTVGSVPYNGQVVSSARWLSPTLLMNYVFLDETAKMRPYIGAGINYTAFYDRNQTAAGNAASGGPTRLSLTSSVGPAGIVGLSYNISGHWNFYASYAISIVKSRIEADTGGEVRTTHINFRPQALILAGGYSF